MKGHAASKGIHFLQEIVVKEIQIIHLFDHIFHTLLSKWLTRFIEYFRKTISKAKEHKLFQLIDTGRLDDDLRWASRVAVRALC